MHWLIRLLVLLIVAVGNWVSLISSSSIRPKVTASSKERDETVAAFFWDTPPTHQARLAFNCVPPSPWNSKPPQCAAKNVRTV